MDNITHLVPVTNSQSVIELVPFQYNHYQQSCIEIHLPDCEYLESIYHHIQKQKQIQEEQNAQLQELIVLLQSLCEKITQ